ncbi:ClpP-like prohead protease/major capsid protein fusion protein [Spartinivicinus ruber]|uniref:ClpP-like prohead protease/major capsid protein fusion protein n=1 Tax=Spartinivicinus ruber TaxID=2683272 RepID=UPI0013D02BC1|nr:ClpP-like prohead protease/major capsid protein fusion protein [Spartinivicinus ruber]
MSKQTWYSIEAKADGVTAIYIYDEIGAYGVSAKGFLEAVKTIKTPAIELHLNSPGGSIFDGTAIYNALRNHPATITGYIDGVAASMASVILQACDVRKVPENAYFMMHNPQGGVYGEETDVESYLSLMKKARQTMIGCYAERSGKTAEDVAQLCDATTWLVGNEIVEAGFADEVINAVEMQARFDAKQLSVFNPPKTLVNQLTPVSETSKNQAPTSHQPKNTPTIVETKETSMPDSANVANAEANFKAKEQTRRTDINALFDGFSQFSELKQTCLNDMDIDLNAAKDKLLEALGKGSEPASGNHRIDARFHASNGRIIRDSLTNMLAARVGLDQLEQENRYKNLSLMESARLALTESGVSAYGMDKMDLVASAFTHTSSDFNHVLKDVAHKAMLKGVDEAEETFTKWTKKGHLGDFKVSHRVGLESFPVLKKVEDGGKYQYATLNDTGEQLQLATYGRKFSITRQTIINDDLDAFTKIPSMMGQAAIRTVGNLVYAVLILNPTMRDGKPLFHADHNNLLKASDINSISLREGKLAMGLQRDGTGTPLNIRPTYLIVPLALEDIAHSYMTNSYDPDSDNFNKINPHKGMATVVADSRLDYAFENKALPWFFAAGNRYDTVEVSYLDGNDKPHLEQQQGWDVDGAEFKVRIDAGVSALSYRTLSKNPGVK